MKIDGDTHSHPKRRSSMSVTTKRSRSQRPHSYPPRGAQVNVFDTVFTRLEAIAYAKIRTRAISYGMVFMGFYRGVGFEFNVYINGQGHLNRKTRQNPVWHKPVTPLDTLRHEIDEVIQRM